MGSQPALPVPSNVEGSPARPERSRIGRRVPPPLFLVRLFVSCPRRQYFTFFEEFSLEDLTFVVYIFRSSLTGTFGFENERYCAFSPCVGCRWGRNRERNLDLCFEPCNHGGMQSYSTGSKHCGVTGEPGKSVKRTHGSNLMRGPTQLERNIEIS